ncbi:MAG: dihydrolipoyl dehydrogenase [Megasphaera cerevisiae]|jgi:dihydrolipoamide dehydrogenase|nr:dihydrolipoyl dehydrogenase [Megasphaera cerevisiae]
MKHYDVIIIGTGAANIVADAALLQGQRIAIIEKGRFGGTCLNRGCIPTKLMVTAANRIREIQEAERIGVHAGDVHLDWDFMSRRLWKKVNESIGIKTYYDQYPNIDIYEGTASFSGKKSLTITLHDGTEAEIDGSKIFIGAGARTNIPILTGLEEAGYLTSETLFGEKYPAQPYNSLIIVGGGPIGCEFAHVFNAAGTKVTIVQHNIRLLPKEDVDISSFLLRQFVSYGIDVRLNQDTVSVHIDGGEKVLTFRNRTTGEESSIRAQEILIAPGIKPLTDLLHLENTDIQTDNRGYITTNEFLETSADGIWALGDINGLAPFRHKANYESEILAHNLFSGNPPQSWRWARYETVPAVTYTYPEAAHVGLTEDQARKEGYEIEIAINHYSDSAKGYSLGYEPGDSDDGFVKLILDKSTKHILGAHIIGPEASILIQPFITLMSCGSHVIRPIHEEIASHTTQMLRKLPLTRTLDPRSVYTISETMTPHPSLSEVTMWTRYYYEKK